MPSDFAAYTNRDLRNLAEGLLPPAIPQSVEACVAFVLAESRGHWHNRARAMMCRRFKHCDLTREQEAALVACIIDRLCTGNFTEQFRDQLRFALAVDRDAVIAGAMRNLVGQSKPHIRRYSVWILEHYKLEHYKLEHYKLADS